MAAGSIGRCDVCGHHLEPEELHPIFRAKLALANLLEIMGMMDSIIAQPSHKTARAGWSERMTELAEKAAAEVHEIVEFGSAFDTDEPMQPQDDEED